MVFETVCAFTSFFFTVPATTEIYTLSLHDALPISMFVAIVTECLSPASLMISASRACSFAFRTDRKSTRLNSSHRCISYAVFCLKKKKIGLVNKHRILIVQLCNQSLASCDEHVEVV